MSAIETSKVRGLVVRDDDVYQQGYQTDHAFRLLRTEAERREYLRPKLVDLTNARVFFDINRDGGTTIGLAAAVGPVVPIIPVTVGGKVYTISLYDDQNNLYIAVSTDRQAAQRVKAKIQRAIWKANDTETVRPLFAALSRRRRRSETAEQLDTDRDL